MMLFLFLILNFVQAHARHTGEILCRHCGASLTRQSELINITGVDPAHLQYEYDFPLVGKTTKVHVLKNPEGQKFHVFGAKTAHLHFHGSPQSHATWYPGFQWTICQCQACNRHMGWYFEPEKETTASTTELTEDADEKKQKSFIGLVLENVISADYVDTLTKVPDF